MQIANQDPSTIERVINSRFLLPEAQAVEHLITFAPTSAALRDSIRATAEALVIDVREAHSDISGLQAFLKHYDLSSNEGVVFLRLAEALVRIPDESTLDAFIADKLSNADWRQHSGAS